MGWLDHLLALAFGVGVPLASARAATLRESGAWTPAEKAAAYRANALALCAMAALVLLVVRLGGRPYARIGLTWPEEALPTLGWIALALLLYALDVAYELAPVRRRRTRRRWLEELPFLPASRAELLSFLPLCVAAAVCEEIVFRGFLVDYLRTLLGGGRAATALAVSLPAFAFAAAHLYQGVRGAVKVAALALLLGASFLTTGSLLAAILVHLSIDVAGGVLAVRLLRPVGSAA